MEARRPGRAAQSALRGSGRRRGPKRPGGGARGGGSRHGRRSSSTIGRRRAAACSIAAARRTALAASAWIAETVAAIEAAGGAFLANATAYGVYDHNLVCAFQRGDAGGADTLWRIRPRHIVVAAGAIERPLLFDHNDRPGILSAEAGLAYLKQYGVRIGERVVVAANNDSAYAVAAALREAGAAVTIVDCREAATGMAAAAAAGVEVRRGERVARAEGRGAVRAARLAGGATIEADALLVSGGFDPTVQLYCQAKGRARLGRAAARLRSRRCGGGAHRRRRSQRRLLARRRAGAGSRRDRRFARRRRRQERAR